MAELTVQNIDKVGTTPTYAAASSGGDTWINGPRTFLHIKNADVGSHTASIAAKVTQIIVPDHGEITIAGIAVAIPAADEKMFTVPHGSYGGKPTVTYDAVTSVTIGAFDLEKI